MIRVLHCPTSIGGNPQMLAKIERELGVNSYSIIFEQNYFQYQPDEVLISESDTRIKYEIKRWNLLYRAIKNFDIIHFNFGQSIAPQKFVLSDSYVAQQYPKIVQYLYYFYSHFFELKDLPLLKILGKKIVVTYQGDDARQGDFCKKHFAISTAYEVEANYYNTYTDKIKRNRINQFARYADKIFALNPDLLHVLPSNTQFLPYAHVQLNDWKPNISQHLSNNLRIVHAPSHRGFKGTRFVLEAIQRLKSEEIPFEFILVEGLAHHEARKLYEKADLLIDQVLAGWYGGLSVELMALGKPVMCYIREEDLKFIPVEMKNDLPIIQVTPTTLYQTLKQYLTHDKERLREIGHQSRVYVEKWHDPYKTAAFLKSEYEAILSRKT